VNSRVPKTRKPKCRKPKISTIVGDSCAVGPGKRGRKFGSRESEREANARTSGEPKPRNPKPRNPEVPKFSKDIRTVEDLTVGSSWTKTPKNEVLKLQSRQSSENFVKPKRFFAHVEL
jgi:hypothetical protein